LLEALSERGFGDAQLSEIKRMINAEKSDLYDVLTYIAFALAPITREERVNTRKASIYSVYSDEKLRAIRGAN
jgi:type I restriction enzyme R subunit